MRYRAALLALAFASGCSLQPRYERPDAPVAATFPSGAAYKPVQVQGGVNLPAADIGWRDFLRDARLQRLVEIALADNRDLRVAVLNVEEVRAQYRISEPRSFPRWEDSPMRRGFTLRRASPPTAVRAPRRSTKSAPPPRGRSISLDG